MVIAIAGAPVSFGVFELTPDDAGLELPTGTQVLEHLGREGYRGVDLGPVGFLGRGAELRDGLRRHGLALSGGWIDLPFSEPVAFESRFADLDLALDVFDEGGTDRDAPGAKPTLADSGDARRKAHPGGGEGLGLGPADWDVLARNVDRAAARIRERGYEPTFHHHACTHVETPDEIETFLRLTDVDLTFDSGHLLIGGGDVLAGWRDWHRRINHIHLKDVRVDLLDRILRGGGGMLDVWGGGTFVPVGAGDLDVASLLGAVVADGYDGWIVIEQDVLPASGDPLAPRWADSVANLAALRAALAVAG